MMLNTTNTNQTETLNIDSRGFLYLKPFRDSYYNQLTIEKLNEYLDAISNIYDKTTSSILVDIRDIFGVVSIDYRCFKLLSKDIRLKKVCKKIAFITNSLPLKLKLDNYITMHKPNVRTRVFNFVEDGIEFCINPYKCNGNSY